MDLVQPMPCTVVNTLLDDGFPTGALSYWKSALFKELSDDAIGIMVEAFAQCPSPMTAVVTLPYLTGRATPSRQGRVRARVPHLALQCCQR